MLPKRQSHELFSRRRCVQLSSDLETMYLSNRVRPQLNRQAHRFSHTVALSSGSSDTESKKSDSISAQSPLVDPKAERRQQAIQQLGLSPNPRPLGNVLASWSPNIDSLHHMLQEHLKVPSLGGTVPPGYHQVSHKRLSSEWHLDDDGAELKHAPGPDYRFRVWSGGSMSFTRPFLPRKTTELKAFERFESSRKFRFGARVSIIQYFNVPGGAHDFPAAFERDDDVGNNLIREEKRLAFFPEIPMSLKTKNYVKDPTARPIPRKAYRTDVVLPTPAMLFHFSALTLNAHAIHLDREFTKSVYGIPDLLVHGPLTSVLMLEMLRKTFVKLGIECKTDNFIKHFQYTNHKPLWVNEEIKIGCKRVEGGVGAPQQQFRLTDRERQTNCNRELWYVWISKGTGENEVIAVDGTAVVSIWQHKDSILQAWLSMRESERTLGARHSARDNHPKDGVIRFYNAKTSAATRPLPASILGPEALDDEVKQNDAKQTPKDSERRDQSSQISDDERHAHSQGPENAVLSENPLRPTSSTAEGQTPSPRDNAGGEAHLSPPIRRIASASGNLAPGSGSRQGATSTPQNPPSDEHPIGIRRIPHDNPQTAPTTQDAPSGPSIRYFIGSAEPKISIKSAGREREADLNSESSGTDPDKQAN